MNKGLSGRKMQADCSCARHARRLALGASRPAVARSIHGAPIFRASVSGGEPALRAQSVLNRHGACLHLECPVVRADDAPAPAREMASVPTPHRIADARVYRPMARLSTNLWGLSLRNPIVIAPSPPTAHALGIIAADRAGAGAVITKSVGPHTECPAPGTDRRQVCYVPGTGLWMQSTYRREILPLAEGRELLLSAKPKVSIPIIASVFCPSFDPEEWTRVAGALAEAGADAIHLDLFYLPLEPPLGVTADRLRSLFAAVVAEVHVPVVVKLNIHLDLVSVVRICEETGVRGLSYLDSARLGNPRSEHDPASYLLPGPPSEMCALAGEWLRPMTMAYTDRLRALTELDLCAGGGLFDSHDAIEALLRGAHAIQLCTALLVRGWGVVREIEDGLKSHLSRAEVASLAELRDECGSAQTSPLVGRVQRVPGMCVGCGRCEAQLMCQARAGSAECESCGFCVGLCPVGAIILR